MDRELRILILEDDSADAELMQRELRNAGITFSAMLVDSREGFIKGLEEFSPDMILSDNKLPSFDGISALDISQKKCPDIPFIFVTGTMGEEWAVETLKRGACDYVLKDRIYRLASVVKRALQEVKERNEHKRAEETIKEHAEQYRTIVSATLFGFLLTDEKAKLLDVNDTYCSMSGYTRKELLNLSISDLEATDKPEDVAARIQRVIESGTDQFESKHKAKDGRVFDIEVSMSFLYSRKQFIAFIRDITDRERVKQELINAKEHAEESDRLKTSFLHNISHEIRTPMNAIVGFSALLGEPDVDAQSRKDYIETIMLSSNHLLLIITDIIDIANIEANIVKVDKNEININSKLKSLCNQFIPVANEKKIQLVCETGVPDSDALIITDSTKLTQILTNLINNAIKFTDKGYVKVGCVLRDMFLEFRVSDTGIGIPQEYHNKIFDRFYQVQHTTSRLYEGTGLGLAIAKAYAELLGGNIRLSSEPGAGTSFFVTIPYEKQVVATETVKEKMGYEVFVFPEKKTILVVEDVDSNFKLINCFLAGANADIIRASNGEEAVEIALAEKNIDLILMDIKMPELDGYTAAKIIWESKPDIPIIAQTAYADDKEEAIGSGCSGFILKPFDKKSLLKVIREFI